MDEVPATPEGLHVFETRVYYLPETGEIVDVHQFVGAPGDTPSSEMVADEMSAGEERVQNRIEGTTYLVVDSREIRAVEYGMRVDPARGRLRTADDSGPD